MKSCGSPHPRWRGLLLSLLLLCFHVCFVQGETSMFERVKHIVGEYRKVYFGEVFGSFSSSSSSSSSHQQVCEKEGTTRTTGGEVEEACTETKSSDDMAQKTEIQEQEKMKKNEEEKEKEEEMEEEEVATAGDPCEEGIYPDAWGFASEADCAKKSACDDLLLGMRCPKECGWCSGRSSDRTDVLEGEEALFCFNEAGDEKCEELIAPYCPTIPSTPELQQEESYGENHRYALTYCAKLCGSCHHFIPSTRCTTPSWERERSRWILTPGGINRHFREVVSRHPEEQPRVLASPENGGTNIVLFEQFLTPDEVAALRNLDRVCPQGFEPSKAGGLVGSVDMATRTSSTCFMSDNAMLLPEVKPISAKIADFTGSPVNNSEHIQLLEYQEGQFYKEHTDYIPENYGQPSGPRYITLFLYLNDVEVGGETSFPALNITIKPKAGRALLWQNVLDGDIHVQDDLTKHIALPVGKGMEKYSANVWTHVYDFRTPHLFHCEY